MIEDKTNIPIWIQTLIYSGRILWNDSSTILDMKIEKESSMLVVTAPYYFSISIHFNDGNPKEVVVYLKYCSLIEDIKFQIQEQTGYLWDDILIFYNENIWEDYQSINLKGYTIIPFV